MKVSDITHIRRTKKFLLWLASQDLSKMTIEYLSKIFYYLEHGWYAPIPGAWLPGSLTPEIEKNSTEICANISAFSAVTCPPVNPPDKINNGLIQDERLIPWINDVEKISYVYVMPIICGLSIVLNSLTILVLSRRNFKGKTLQSVYKVSIF